MKCAACDGSNVDEKSFVEYAGEIVCVACFPKIRIAALEIALLTSVQQVEFLEKQLQIAVGLAEFYKTPRVN